MKETVQVIKNKINNMSYNRTTTAGSVKVQYNTEMLSLYEYLGKAAGPELGKAVAEAATMAKVKIDSHEVSNSKYTGRILKYPKTFLDAYFGEIKTTDDELPF